MMITSGYIAYPPSDPRAQPITFDPTTGGVQQWDGTIAYPANLRGGHNGGSVVLTVDYYPIPCSGLGPRESFLTEMPFVCRHGRNLVLPVAEAVALVTLGAALPA